MDIATTPFEPDAAPKVPGWYVAEAAGGLRGCVLVWEFYGRLYVSEVGREGGVLVEEYERIFVARLRLDAPALAA